MRNLYSIEPIFQGPNNADCLAGGWRINQFFKTMEFSDDPNYQEFFVSAATCWTPVRSFWATAAGTNLPLFVVKRCSSIAWQVFPLRLGISLFLPKKSGDRRLISTRIILLIRRSPSTTFSARKKEVGTVGDRPKGTLLFQDKKVKLFYGTPVSQSSPLLSYCQFVRRDAKGSSYSPRWKPKTLKKCRESERNDGWQMRWK